MKKLPVLVPKIATDLSSKGGCGEQEAQSRAFFKSLVIELFYYGLAIRIESIFGWSSLARRWTCKSCGKKYKNHFSV